MSSSAIFASGNESYQVSKIVYAGPVSEVPEDRRRNGTTHSFKIITGLGTAFAYYKSEDDARKARGVLYGMLETLKPKAFRHGNEFIDPAHIVSFSSVIQFKKPVGEYTHGIVVSVETTQEKSREIWLRYKSEDHAQKGRKALWATVHGVNGMTAPAARAVAKQPVTEEVPF